MMIGLFKYSKNIQSHLFFRDSIAHLLTSNKVKESLVINLFSSFIEIFDKEFNIKLLPKVWHIHVLVSWIQANLFHK